MRRFANKQFVHDSSKIFLMVSGCQMVTLFCLVLLLINEYLNTPFQCLIVPPSKAIETYCLIHSTYVFNDTSKYDLHPGVGPQLNSPRIAIQQKYFFWIPYLLTLQVLLFGLPRLLWDSMQGTLVKKLLEYHQGFEDRNWMKRMDKTSRYFVATLHTHKSRAFQFLFCEALGIATIGANIIFSNWYLNGKFIRGVPSILANIGRMGKMESIHNKIFPKISSCDFYKFGSSGTIMKESALCILARNLLSSRIYTLLFVIYFASGIIACSLFIIKISIYAVPSLRAFLILKKTPEMKPVKENLKHVMKFCDIGDWFVLYQLSCSMVNFDVWLEATAGKLHNFS